MAAAIERYFSSEFRGVLVELSRRSGNEICHKLIYHVSHIRARRPHAQITHMFTRYVVTGEGKIVPWIDPSTGRFLRHTSWTIARFYAEYRADQILCSTLTPQSLSYVDFAPAVGDAAVGPVSVVYPTPRVAKAAAVPDPLGFLTLTTDKPLQRLNAKTKTGAPARPPARPPART